MAMEFFRDLRNAIMEINKDVLIVQSIEGLHVQAIKVEHPYVVQDVGMVF